MNLPDSRNDSGRPGRLALRVGLLLVAAGLAAGALWHYTRPKPVMVVIARVDAGRVENTVANTRAGSVMACRRGKLAPPAGGRIERINVHEGDRVQKGQVLLTLWNDDLTARERVSREQLQTARARVREVCELAKASARDARRSRELREPLRRRSGDAEARRCEEVIRGCRRHT